MLWFLDPKQDRPAQLYSQNRAVHFSFGEKPNQKKKKNPQDTGKEVSYQMQKFVIKEDKAFIKNF